MSFLARLLIESFLYNRMLVNDFVFYFDSNGEFWKENCIGNRSKGLGACVSKPAASQNQCASCFLF